MTPTPSGETPILMCNEYCLTFLATMNFNAFSDCRDCSMHLCAGDCPSMFPQYCSDCYNIRNRRRRKRRSIKSPQILGHQEQGIVRVKRQLQLADYTSPYIVNLPGYQDLFCCTPIQSNQSARTEPIDYCLTLVRRIDYPYLNQSRYRDIICTPAEDPFNPCLDLLGTSDGLRAAIWMVCLLALVGNILVFVVFIGYSVIIRRAQQDLFAIHFMYFNLALADFFMGMYLFIIAVVDADTKGSFYLRDIAWRTGHGCGFAGFCAILSTVVSVYVLVVITLERTYTITQVFKRKKLTRIRVCIIMGVGWLIGVFYAMLPLVGVNDYSTVAICLPFNVTKSIGRAYVVFLLLVTGIAFIVIAICYGMIFQQVFCKCGKIGPIQDKKRRITDMKIAIRIFILIFTNLVCWFPIALMSLTAAFNKSLVSNLEFARWAIVFVFPINACLNPFLYSITTRVFRDQFILILNKCGLFKKRAHRIKNAQVGITPSYTSKTSNTSGGFANNKFVSRLRSFSLTSQGSTLNLLERMNRRASATGTLNDSGGLNHLRLYNSNIRRTSNASNTSSDEMSNSRRGSAFSAGSNDVLLGTIYTNNGLLSSGSLEAVKENGGTAEVQNRARAKISASSLGVLPEEDGELPVEAIIDEGVVKINPAYEEDDNTKESGRDSGMVEEASQEEVEDANNTEVIGNQNACMDDDDNSDSKNNEDSESGSSSS